MGGIGAGEADRAAGAELRRPLRGGDAARASWSGGEVRGVGELGLAFYRAERGRGRGGQGGGGVGGAGAINGARCGRRVGEGAGTG
jgi:hypothetical protein